MAISANGYVAREDDSTPWSSEEWEAWREMAESVGNLVIGRKTYDILNAEGELGKMSSVYKIVVTSTPGNHKERDGFSFVKTPEEAVNILKEKGFQSMLISGGSGLNTTFFEKELVDEIYLDVEPRLIGKGISLIRALDRDFNLKLLEHRKLSDNTMQLHYKIVF